MSRFLRALGLGGGASSRSHSRFDTPQVRRIRETMRWRGYDLSEYSDEQIVRAIARLSEGVSEQGETTEAGRRALADALAGRDFNGPAAPVFEEPTVTADEEPTVPAANVPEPPRSEAGPQETAPLGQEGEPETGSQPAAAGPAAQEEREGADASRAELGVPKLLERAMHLFGIHSWHEGDGAGVRCIGCGRSRNGPIAMSRAPDLPDARPSPAEPATPLELPTREERPRERASGSPWQFFLGLPLWSKLLAAFILLQVILWVISLIGGAT